MEERLLTKIKKSFLYILTGDFVSLLAAFLAGYSYAVILGPNDYGVWQTAKVFISYSIIFTFSLPFVMRRDFVMLRAEGRHEEARKIADLVFTYELFVTPILSLGLILYSFLYIENHLFKVSIITVGLIYLFQFVGGYSNFLAKGLNNYKLLKDASIINGILTVCSIPLVYLWGIYALLASTLILSIVNSVYYYIKRPFNYRIFWDSSLFKKLLFISFPLYLQDINSTIFDSIDRLLIAKYLNFSEVGFYSLSGIVIIPLRLAISGFSMVLFTQLNEKHGFSKDEQVVRQHVIIPHSILSYAIPPIIGLAVIVLPYFVQLFLPEYKEGITAAQVGLFAVFIFLLNSFSANALFVVNKQKITAIIYFIIGLIKTALCFVSITMGYGIVGIAISTGIAYVTLDFLMLMVVFNQIGKSAKELISYFVKGMFPVTWIASACWLYIRYISIYLIETFGLSEAMTMGVGIVFILACSSILIYIAYDRVSKLVYSNY